MKRFPALAVAAALAAPLFTSVGVAQTQTRFSKQYKFPWTGNEPVGIIAGPNGVFYGMTAGIYDSYGSVFELQDTGGKWSETVLYTFTGQNGDGANGSSRVVPVLGPDGTIYGATAYGGAYEGGTIFQLQPPAVSGGTWTETILYSFDDSGGFSNVILGPGGKLYGFTAGGGAYGQGTVFELTPPGPAGTQSWTERVLYSFTGASDGANPSGLSLGAGGVLYGSTSAGGSVGEGTVFELTPPSSPHGSWNETVLYSFIGDEAGGNPYGPPVVNSDGSLYGTTCCSVYQLTPPATAGGNWVQTMLYSFFNFEGGPDSNLVVNNGNIYLTISSLICICYCSGGEVVELQKQPSGAWTKTDLHRLYGSEEPYGTLVMDSSGDLFGTTLGGPGIFGGGILYRIDPSLADSEDTDENNSGDSVCGSPRLPSAAGRRR